MCQCLHAQYKDLEWSELRLHSEPQDTTCSGWKRLLELVEEAADDKREEFAPFRSMTSKEYGQVLTLPPTIAKLKSVKKILLYGSAMVRIPPEIGEMESLEDFDTYTSYRLHWYPYEITRCKRLKDSAVSTRALYGNYKYRPPFPRLPQPNDAYRPANCSVCDGPFEDSGPRQWWISLRVATDVLPLLVHACSHECVERLPTPPRIYVRTPHMGGLDLIQPTERHGSVIKARNVP